MIWSMLCSALKERTALYFAHYVLLFLSLTVCIHLILVLYVYFSIACLYFYMYTLFGSTMARLK